MNLTQLNFLLPCRSLEELTLDRSADEAEQILAAWCGLYHPALLANTKSVPKWCSAQEPPPEPAGRLIVVPPCCVMLTPSDWSSDAQSAGAMLIQAVRGRQEITAAALERLDMPVPAIDPELEADFYALGYCNFLIEALTQQLRYMSNLDEASYRSAAVAAAEAALAGNVEAARERLAEAFRTLHQAREYFYPVESHLLDLTLVAPTTLGASLRAELQRTLPGNLLLSGETLEAMAQSEPQTLERLREAVAEERFSIVGGERSEHLLPLLPLEAIRAELLRGRAVYERLLGRAPKVFGRRKFGLTPTLPQALRMLGFVGAIHATLDDGRFPTVNQSRLEWAGVDGEGIEAVARVPFDVARGEVFFQLPQKLGNSMDVDHVATSVFAHWPGQTSVWYEMLKRIASYISAGGKFETVEEYFQQTGTTGQHKQHAADDYRSPYLRQAVDAGESDPISRWMRFYGRRARLDGCSRLEFLASALRGAEDAAGRSQRDALGGLYDRVDALPLAAADDASIDEQIGQAEKAACKRFAAAIGCRADEPRGTLLINPLSSSRAAWLDVPAMEPLPDTGGPVVAAVRCGDRMHAAVDVPAMGFAFVRPGSGAAPPAKPRWFFAGKPKAAAPVARQEEDGFVLENEFFQAVIDRNTGALRALFTENVRGPRIAQQLALRQPGRDSAEGDATYSIMAADEVVVVSGSEALGEIVARGRLCDRLGRRVAGFVQRTRARRGSRLVEIEIELDPSDLPGEDPWASYYAARFAWGDGEARLRRGVNQALLPTELARLESPTCVEIASGKARTAILTGGLPYHRRDGNRKLDSLLIVRGETARTFRLGIGIDLPNPIAAADEFVSPVLALEAGAPPSSHAWLFHIEAGSVIATHWEAIVSDGRVQGFRARLLETSGKQVRTALRSFRAVRAAERKNFDGMAPTMLRASGDRVTFDIRPWGWIEIEAMFG